MIYTVKRGDTLGEIARRFGVPANRIAADNLIKYMNWLANGGKRESMAHFCSVFEGATYTKANLFMMSKAPRCFKTITEFIKNL